MADSYDLILKGGTVVNHDGEGVRDLGVPAAGSPRSATSERPPPRCSTAAACTSCRA